MNGVAVRDGELILWGMKAMVHILYFNVLNHIKTSIFERNCLYIPISLYIPIYSYTSLFGVSCWGHLAKWGALYSFSGQAPGNKDEIESDQEVYLLR